MSATSVNRPSRTARSVPRPWPDIPRRLRSVADPYVFSTASLTPVVIAVAILAQIPGEIWRAAALSVIAVGVQIALSGRRRPRWRHAQVAWPLIRIAVPLLYVAASVQLVGGPGLPLLSLYVPVVAGAAAIGSVQGAITAAVATLVYLAPEIGNLGSPAGVVLRGVSLAGVAIVMAFGTRGIVASLQSALRSARAAAVAERRRARQIDALDVVGRLLASAGPSAELLDRVIEVIVQRFRYPHVSIYLGDAERVELVGQRGYVEAIAALDATSGVAGRVMRERTVAFVPDVGRDPDYVAGPLDATSLICAPLVIDGRLLGIINVETTGGRRLDRTDLSLIGILAGRLGTAVALGADRQALSARGQLFHDIGTFATEVSASLAVGPLAEAIADALGRVMAADTVSVTLLDRDDGRYIVRAIRGGDASAVGREVTLGDGLVGRAIRDRAVVVEEATDTFGAPPRDRSVPWLTHGLGLPLVRDGVVVGALTVGRAEAAVGFTELEREGLALISSHAALAVANAFLHAEVAELAVRDPLTGLYNRRYFDEALDRMLATRRRDRLAGWRPLSAIVFDLDQFGRFNKEHGHQVGDQILRMFSGILDRRFRAGDLVARLGGEEFIVVLDGADRQSAVSIADEVRQMLAGRTIRSEDGAELGVTVSAGCTELDRVDPSREGLLRTADVALFMAKRAGRDRVVAA